jgi:hypothetical protein
VYRTDGSYRLCIEQTAATGCVTNRRQLQAVCHTNGSYRLCIQQTAATGCVSNRRQLQAVHRTDGSYRLCIEQTAATGCVSHKRQIQDVCQTTIKFQSTYSKTLLLPYNRTQIHAANMVDCRLRSEYLNIVTVLHGVRSKNSQLMLYRDILAVCSEILTNHITWIIYTDPVRTAQ